MESKTIQVLAFAQARDLLGFSEKAVVAHKEETPRQVIESLSPAFAALNPTFRIALDEEYAMWDQPINSAKVLAIIPPVSGG